MQNFSGRAILYVPSHISQSTRLTSDKYDIPVDQITRGLKMVLATEIVFALSCTLTKLSMLLLVRRILASASRFWRRTTLFVIWIVGLQGSIFCLTVLFQCRPISASWAVTVEKNPNCIDDDTSLLVAGIINTFTDFVVVLLPIRAVWNLKLPSQSPRSISSSLNIRNFLPTRRTVPLVVLFALGFLSCVAGGLRTYYTWEISKTWDKIWASYPVWVWGALELYIGIVNSLFLFSISATVYQRRAETLTKKLDMCFHPRHQTILLSLPSLNIRFPPHTPNRLLLLRIHSNPIYPLPNTRKLSFSPFREPRRHVPRIARWG
jgi:hypothetical protein